MYLAHTYGRYPASAIAVSKVLQYISDEVLPLTGKPLYDYLGLGDLPFQRFDFWSFQRGHLYLPVALIPTTIWVKRKLCSAI
jgi:hypothetical protein